MNVMRVKLDDQISPPVIWLFKYYKIPIGRASNTASKMSAILRKVSKSASKKNVAKLGDMFASITKFLLSDKFKSFNFYFI